MTTTPAPRTTGETIDSVFIFLRRSFLFWKRAFVIFFLVALTSIPGVFMKARIYKSETVVLYQEQIRSNAITGREGQGGEEARRVGARLKETLLSRASLEPIVNGIPRYAKIADKRGAVDAVEELKGHIGFKARDGDTFEISYEGATPEEAQDVTKKLGDRIVQEATDRRSEAAKATKDFLITESDQNKASLKISEGGFADFLTKHPEFIPLTGPNGSKSGGMTPFVPPPVPPGTKDPVLFQLQAEADRLERQIRVSKGLPVSAPRRNDESPELQAARKDLADKSASFTDKHPDVVAARQRVAALEAAQRTKPAEDPVAPASDFDRAAAEARLGSLRTQIQQRRVASGSLPAPKLSASAQAAANAAAADAGAQGVANEVEFRRLQRELEDLRDHQKQLDERLFQASISANASNSDKNIQVTILDPAYKPAHPTGRGRGVGLAMFLAAAMALAVLTALISTRLDDRIYERRELEMLDVLPVVGAIPRASKK